MHRMIHGRLGTSDKTNLETFEQTLSPKFNSVESLARELPEESSQYQAYKHPQVSAAKENYQNYSSITEKS